MFPSAAGFYTSQTFITDDEGTYLLDTRDAPVLVERGDDGSMALEPLVEALKGCVKKLQDRRLQHPAEVPYTEAHNTWMANQPGTLLLIPVGDLAQHILLALAYPLQNGQVITDDINGRAIPGMERFSDIVVPDAAWPINFLEQWVRVEIIVGLSTGCYARTLMLQAMGLGGWMFNGLAPFSVSGATGDPASPGLGFRASSDNRVPKPKPT